MRIDVERTVDGGEIEVLVPESDEDIAELERLARAGKLDDALSFGDQPPPGSRRRRRCRDRRR